MGERDPNASPQEAMFADYQRLKQENAALRRLLFENGIQITGAASEWLAVEVATGMVRT